MAASPERKRTPARRRPETIDEKLDRILSEPIDTPINVNKREALALLRALSKRPPIEPDSPPGDEQVKRFYGLWPDDSTGRKTDSPLGYNTGMVTSRKQKPASPRGKRETMEEKFQRILSEPIDAPIKVTKREARYMLLRLWEIGDPDSEPPGDEQVKRFYGLWPDPKPGEYPE